MFKFMWVMESPIDFFEGAMIASEEEAERVIDQMPEHPRHNVVFKVWVPDEMCFTPVFICKADNNGDTYLFADRDVFGYLKDSLKQGS